MEPGGSGHFPAQGNASEAAEDDKTKEDLVGEPYAVVESDPGSFWSHCEHENHKYFRCIHIYHTTAWCIGC